LDHTWAAAKTVRGRALQKMEGGGLKNICSFVQITRVSKK